MACIHFKGKSSIANHHLAVPYHHLRALPGKSLPVKGGNPSLHGNMIIHGDNLLALKALLPTHAGKINCVYIDPPYNTGNEGWCYNDRVNHPVIREWLGKEVDCDDLTRHDKWLCMMWPRLSLLHELLAEDGVIFISIDDNEQHRLRMMMDEVFGEANFLNCFTWISNLKGRQISNSGASRTHEYILVYAKNIQESRPWHPINIKTATGLMPDAYRMPGNHRVLKDEIGEYVVKNELHNTNSAFNEETRPNLVFNIHYHPGKKRIRFSEAGGGKRYQGFSVIHPKPCNDGVHQFHAWRWSREKIVANMHDLHFENRNGHYVIYTKVRNFAVTNMKDLITNINGGAIAKAIVNFPNPKPPDMIKLLIQHAAPASAVVLDSFAGSGTTAHAVLALNKEDGGNRKFILVECEDYADTVTARRVRRVIRGVKGAKDVQLKTGLGGCFGYWELGDPLEMQSILEGENLPSYDELARYVFYTATGEQWSRRSMRKRLFLAGESQHYQVYLFYKPDVQYLRETSLTLEVADALPPAGDKWRLVYAPASYADPDDLGGRRIKFCQLPYQIYRMAE